MIAPDRGRSGAAATGAAPPAIVARGLALGYDSTTVLDGVDFELPAGRSLCLLGPNGGGKTTLLRAISGDLAPARGTLAVAGRVAHLAQTDRTRLDFPVSALDVALMGTLATGRWWLPPRRADRRAALAALERVGLEERAGSRFGELSGGQRQRVLLARALVQDAAVIALDEPLAGVDPASGERIADLFAALRAEGRTLLVSSHDVLGAREFDAVICLNGRQVAFGSPDRTLTPPVLERTYGSEIVVLGEGPHGEPVRGIAVGHHDHDH